MRVAACFIALVPFVLAACAGNKSEPACAKTVVSGTVTYRERIALPPDAVVDVRLVDAARADGPAVTIAEQTILSEGRQVPIPFSLVFDGAAVSARARLVLQARISFGDDVRWVSTSSVPVDQGNIAGPFEILVRPVR